MTDIPEHLQPDFGFNVTLGARLTDWGDGFVAAEIPIREDLLNSGRIVHGGVHASFLDMLLGFAGCFNDWKPRRACVTLNLNVSFLASTGEGVLRGRAWVTGGGRKIWFAEGEVKDDDGRVLARGQGSFRYIGGPTG